MTPEKLAVAVVATGLCIAGVLSIAGIVQTVRKGLRKTKTLQTGKWNTYEVVIDGFVWYTSPIYQEAANVFYTHPSENRIFRMKVEDSFYILIARTETEHG